jgi:SNF2 family DNA or RNA helicase
LYLPAAQLEDLRRVVSIDDEANTEQMTSEVRLLMRAREAVLTTLSAPETKLLSNFVEKHQLDAHQVHAVAAATHPDVKGLCLFDEQGLGKTVTTLFAFHRLRSLGEVKRMLVICPKNVALEWSKDASRFFPSTYRVQTVLGTEREKRTALNKRAEIYVTNFETAIQLRIRLKELLMADQGASLLVIDESFYVKNAKALRSRAIRSLAPCAKRRLVLCGTPAPNAPQDIVEQFNIADNGVAFHGVSIPDDRDSARLVVQRTLGERGVYIRRLKRDVLPHLPSRTFQRVVLRMQPIQETAYNAALTDYIHELREVNDLTFKKQLASFMARRTALLQICSNPSAVLKGYSELPAKLVALDELLHELIGSRHEKVLVWSFFRSSLDAICERYQQYDLVRLDGSVTDMRLRREAINRFQEDDTTMLFVGNPAAAGAGLTLHRARYAVYESMSNQGAHYLQSLDRIHRRGQRLPVEYLVLLCDGTIELQQYDSLRSKERAAAKLLGDAIVEVPTKTAMLHEALRSAAAQGIET